MHKVSRLINYFIPTNYDLNLWLDQPNKSFRGIVTITGVMPESAFEIRLHAKDLNIESVTIDGKTADWTADINDEVVLTRSDLKPGEHVVTIKYAAAITDAMHGLYPSYFEHEGQPKQLLATQFESHHAREVFPSVDEPEAKATFDLRLYSQPGQVALSNMPIEKQVEEDGWLVTSFQTTPKMSTYLLAFVVGDLHKKSRLTKSGVEVNVWATPVQRPASLDFALDIATRTIDLFDEYFGVAYPLPKSDHVALPDFSSGAMENWGLITYREIALLADPATTSISSKQYIATVITHELSHQWFGNLVTMKWWDSLWLNESFATLMEYVAVDALEPDWNIWLEYSSNESILALQRDAIAGVQPVQTDVNHPDEISTLFDGAIVYAKGARLLRMLQQYLGEDQFQAGLRRYFESHAYQNTEAEDLWSALAAASGKDVSHLMSVWLSQSGYPVVSVRSEDNKLLLDQAQFFTSPNSGSQQLWPVPLNSAVTGLPELFDTKELIVDRPEGELVKLNTGDYSHFITNYSPDLLAKLTEAIKSGQLTPLDRLQLLHEQVMLTRGQTAPADSLIELLKGYVNEDNHAVWSIISLAIGELKKYVEDSPEAEAGLKQLAVDLARQQYERLGSAEVADEPEDDRKLRGTVFGLMLYGEDPAAIKAAVDAYQNNSIEDLPGELRPLIISAYVRHHGDLATVSQLLETYRATASADLQTDLAIGITSTRDSSAIEFILKNLLNTDAIRPQDLARWYIYMLRSRYARASTWSWLTSNWSEIRAAFAGDKSYDDYPRYAAGVFFKAEDLANYTKFFKPMMSEPALTRTIEIGIKEIEGRVSLVEAQAPAVHEALTK